MGAVKNLYIEAAAELFDELHRDPTADELDERVRVKIAKAKERK